MIRVEKLRKTFGEFVAVNDISFEVQSGEIFAFLGPNGAGKTTTIKMLTTLLQPTSGKVQLNGHDVIHEPAAARQSFGIVFQDPSLDDELTAEENMEIHGVLYHVPKDLRRQRTEQLLKMVDVWDRRTSFTKTFSGGMRRRLEIARGLLHHPKILFLDEPTLGLDPQTREHIWDYIRKLNAEEKITVFFTTHYMPEAERTATRAAIIDRGSIIAQGTPDQLKADAQTSSLEEAFIKLTGHGIREEEAGSLDQMRMHRRLWGGGGRR